MNVIGTTVLSDYGAKHPEALPLLRALHALLVQANWTGRDSVERECGAIARFKNDARVEMVLNEANCRVVLNIHYELGLVRILAVKDLEGERGK